MRAAESASTASRRRALSAAAETARPSCAVTAQSVTAKAVPPVLRRRASISSAVTLRVRAVSGTGPVTVTLCPSPSAAVREMGAPAVTEAERRTGTLRSSPLS